MKKGKKKTLEDENIPGLSEIDSAESCYLIFEELLNKQKQVDLSSQPSVLKTILICHRKEIIVSGFFALLKVVLFPAGPLLLNAFIKVAEKEMQVSEMRDFYWPFCFSLQRAWSPYRKDSALPRTYNLLHTVGLATIASLVVIILTVLCNTPLAKLQHKFQTKLMVAQDDRLKAISKAPVSMKDPVRIIPDVIGVVIQAKVSFERIVKFLEASELEMENLRREHIKSTDHAVLIKSANLSWEENPSR
ncbi:hypothetical protein HAX54_030031 [Datura stramonium]|uniref:Uncharacterized protein n=1 Tax=Datura stramonium TaxID=4076 RepID=A0ABS8V7D4_DATST|nr:hypothetical protein [Datura stramonium]